MSITFTRNSTSYLPDGTLVNTNLPRYVAGRFGQAIMVEEGTTNRLPVGSENFVTGWAMHWGGSVIVTPNQPDPFGGTAAFRIQSTGGTSTHKYGVALSAPNPYTGSVSVWGRVLSGNAGLVIDGGSPNPWFTTTWQRLSSTVNNWAHGYTNMVFRTASVADNLDILVCLPQHEAHPYATTWQLSGTPRVAETLTVPTAGVLSPTEGTIEFWAWLPHGPQSYLFAVEGALDNHNRLFIYGTSIGSANQNMRALLGDGSTWVETTTISTPRQQWHYMVLRWTPTLLRFTINTTTTQVARSGTAPTFGANAFIGSSLGWAQANAFIDDLRISNRARTDAEILANFQSGQPATFDAIGDQWIIPFDGSLASIRRVDRTGFNIVNTAVDSPFTLLYNTAMNTSVVSNIIVGSDVVFNTSRCIDCLNMIQGIRDIVRYPIEFPATYKISKENVYAVPKEKVYSVTREYV